MDKTDRRHQAIRSALTQRLGPGTGAQAALGLWRDLALCLAPMIGTGGFDALFLRSLHLTLPAFPWLAGEPAERPVSLAGLRARLESSDPDAAAEASLAMLVTFTDLLAIMIGQSLTDRLLDPVWAPPAPASSQETAP
ncbi:MAG: hypothetical protein P4L36_08760 [Holophaga sp.]|nr:hypothetical protein [Holophaga sp.]